MGKSWRTWICNVPRHRDPWPVVVSCSLHKFCWKRGACVSQMFDSHKLKVCSIAGEFIIPIILDDCIEQGYRGWSLGTRNGQYMQCWCELVERIAASRQRRCYIVIELRSSTGRLDKMYTRESLFKLSIRDSALLFCLPSLRRYVCGSASPGLNVAALRESMT